MTVVVGILLSVFAFVTFVVVMGVFYWAAKKDGEDQRARDRSAG